MGLLVTLAEITALIAAWHDLAVRRWAAAVAILEDRHD